jgi:hypothetical protein
LHKSPRFLGYFSPLLKLLMHFDKKLYGPHLGRFFHKPIWSPCFLGRVTKELCYWLEKLIAAYITYEHFRETWIKTTHSYSQRLFNISCFRYTLGLFIYVFDALRPKCSLGSDVEITFVCQNHMFMEFKV